VSDSREVQDRACEVLVRLDELRVRRSQLQKTKGGGSTREQAAHAAERSVLARERAFRAYERAIHAHLSASAVHARIADLYEDLARERQADPGWLGRAEHHRRASLLEAERADEARRARAFPLVNDQPQPGQRKPYDPFAKP
jgi:hypothetical protein